MLKVKWSNTVILFFLLAGILILSGCEGPMGPQGDIGGAGPQGEQGDPGGNIPGGRIRLYYMDSINADSVLRICFDPDEFVLSGNEITVDIPLEEYIIYGNQVDRTIYWRAPGVPPGDYFVYAWTDLNGNGIMDAGSPSEKLQGPVVLYNPFYFYGASLDAYIDFTDMEIKANDLPELAPNYTFWEDFASEIDFEINYSWV